MDIRTRTTFRDRLDEAVRRSGLTRSAFAEEAGVDRTTLTQLLTPGNTRRPRLDTIVALAATHDLSADWLLGLGNVGPLEAEIIQHTSFAAPGPTPVDERLLGWLGEAADHKIRYVPATLPDLLKTDAVIRYERAGEWGPNAEQTIETTAARLVFVRNPDTEMECCSSLQAVAGFARGEGIWSRLSVTSRREQLERLIELTGELYPTFRWFLYDGTRRYAPPVTIFGPQRAALYLGHLYLVLTSVEHVRTLIRHHDALIKVASVEPSRVPAHLARLRRDLDR